MTNTASDTALKRKVEAGRGHGGDAPPPPARAIGHAVAKAAQEVLGLPLGVIEAREFRASVAELPERLPERPLLAVMAGPGEAVGLMALSQATLASLIEMQTTGRLGPAEIAPRRPTRTDAAMSVRFLDRVMEELELLLAADPAITWAGGFRYGRFLDDPRPLGLLLEDTGYRILHLTLGFGAGGARRGTLLFAVPAEGRGPAPAIPGGAAAAAAGGADWICRLEQAVLGAQIRIEAVLERVSLPLAAVLALKPGALLPLAPGALGRVRLEGHGRRLVATGRLGQAHGNLAIRLHPPVREIPADDGLPRLGLPAAGANPAAGDAVTEQPGS